jgi:excisionase family DNA binding protein
MDRLLSTEEVAELLGTTQPQVRNMVTRNELRAYKLNIGWRGKYRFEESAVREYLAAHEEGKASA